MENQGEKLRWGVVRRLEFIDFRLFWDGRFNRKDMVDTFGISPQQASVDIRKYEKMAPDNLTYDRADKVYRRGRKYRPALIGSTIDRYLLQLVAVENQWMLQEDTWFGTIPTVEIATLACRRTDSTVLLRVLQAIRNGLEIDIKYASLTGSTQRSRAIAPHALAHNSGHWYARSWSRDHNDFRDYKLNRISEVADFRPSSVDPALDLEWVHKINLVIVPNPNLPSEKRAAIANDFGMVDGCLIHPCRLSLSFYLISQYNLEIRPGVLRPEKQQIVLQNQEEVDRAREAVRQMSTEALSRIQAAGAVE